MFKFIAEYKLKKSLTGLASAVTELDEAIQKVPEGPTKEITLSRLKLERTKAIVAYEQLAEQVAGDTITTNTEWKVDKPLEAEGKLFKLPQTNPLKLLWVDSNSLINYKNQQETHILNSNCVSFLEKALMHKLESEHKKEIDETLEKHGMIEIHEDQKEIAASMLKDPKLEDYQNLFIPYSLASLKTLKEIAKKMRVNLYIKEEYD